MKAEGYVAASLLVSLLLLALGCQTTKNYYKGAKADPEDILHCQLSEGDTSN